MTNRYSSRRNFILGALGISLGVGSTNLANANPLLIDPTPTPVSPLREPGATAPGEPGSYTSFIQDTEITWTDGFAPTDDRPYENLNAVKDYIVLERQSLLIDEEIVVAISLTASAVGVSPSEWIDDTELTESQLLHEWKLPVDGEIVHREADDNVAWMTTLWDGESAGLTVYRWPETSRREWISVHVSFNSGRPEDIEVVNEAITIHGIPLLDGVDIEMAQRSLGD